MLQELVAGVSHVLLGKGFSSVQQGIKIAADMNNDGGPAELVFPCPVSARGFYAMFQDYHWESSNNQCAVVRLTNAQFQKEMSSPELRSFFAESEAVTPANIWKHLSSQQVSGALHGTAAVRIEVRFSS